MREAARLFLSFSGRIGRQQWWLAIVALFVVETAYFWWSHPGYYAAPVATAAETLANLVFMIPMAAIMVKRFNDRNWPWWLGYAAQIPLLAFVAGDYLGYFADEENVTYAQVGIYVTFGVSVILALIDNGFFKGTIGANRFGPDPVAP